MRKFPHQSRFTAAALAGLSAFLLTTSAAVAGGFSVPVDEVRMLDFHQPVATVYVGNPVIADVTVIDSQHVFVLGKNFGVTNIVALDSKGKEVTNKQVSVLARSGGVVTLERGTARITYACSGSHCAPAPTVGDDNSNFENATGQMDKHTTQARTAIVDTSQ